MGIKNVWKFHIDKLTVQPFFLLPLPPIKVADVPLQSQLDIHKPFPLVDINKNIDLSSVFNTPDTLTKSEKTIQLQNIDRI